MEGTNKARENGEAMGLVGVRLTDQLGNATLLSEMLCVDAIFDAVNGRSFSNELEPHAQVHRKRY